MSPQTAAHTSIAPRTQPLRDLVYDAIEAAKDDGLTSTECAELLGIDYSAIQPRTSELFHEGYLAKSKTRRQNASGKTATVWIAA